MLEIYTDGACRGNGKKDAVGGWAFVVVRDGKAEKIKRGALNNTASQRTELTAMIKALEYLTGDFKDKYIGTPVIYTDSQYVQNGINVWIKNWIKKNWTTYDRQPVKNKDLWLRLYELTEKLNTGLGVAIRWIKGHNGNEFNELADEHARFARELIVKSPARKFVESKPYRGERNSKVC